jgi:hypothetical protein
MHTSQYDWTARSVHTRPAGWTALYKLSAPPPSELIPKCLRYAALLAGVVVGAGGVCRYRIFVAFSACTSQVAAEIVLAPYHVPSVQAWRIFDTSRASEGSPLTAHMGEVHWHTGTAGPAGFLAYGEWGFAPHGRFLRVEVRPPRQTGLFSAPRQARVMAGA